MSGVLKFRAWDGLYGKMMFSEQGKLSEFFHAVEQRENAKQPVPVMQFTGLLDKDGKEIYEGDIFKVMRGGGIDIMQGEIYVRDGCSRMKYGYQEPGDRRKGYFLSSVIEKTSEQLEIIGNIYENPELLAV